MSIKGLEQNRLSAGEFATWRTSPATKKVFAILEKIRGDFVSDLVNGSTLRGGEQTIEETAKQIGIIYGLDLLLQMTVKDRSKPKTNKLKGIV